MNFLVRPPALLRFLYARAVWRMPSAEQIIYLTFDDGPINDVTPWILNLLQHYTIKATFFCVGDNVQKNPLIFNRIVNEGHKVGNHTFNHLKGWKTSTSEYLKNVARCEVFTESKLFRPPYGKIKTSQFKEICKEYKVIFWDVLTHDYDSLLPKETCLKNSIKYTRNGSIVVFHDNIKAENTLKYVLPKYIEHFIELNYKFAVL